MIVWPDASLSVSWSALTAVDLAADRDPAAAAPKKPPWPPPWPFWPPWPLPGLTWPLPVGTGRPGTGRPAPATAVAGAVTRPDREADATDGEDRGDHEDDVHDAALPARRRLRDETGLTGRLEWRPAPAARAGRAVRSSWPVHGGTTGGGRRPGRRRLGRVVGSGHRISPTRSEGRRWGRGERPAARATRRRRRRRRG